MEKKQKKKQKAKLYKSMSLMNPKSFEPINEQPELNLTDQEISDDLESIEEENRNLFSEVPSEDYYTVTEVTSRSSKSDLKSNNIKNDLDESKDKLMSLSDLNDLGSVGDIRNSTMVFLKEKKSRKIELFYFQMKIVYVMIFFCVVMVAYLIYTVFTTDVGFLNQIEVIK